MNVSSIVVKTVPGQLAEAIDALNALDFCEVHFYDSEGRIVVTIEGKRINDQMEIMKRIQNMPFVQCADLAYSYCEGEMRESLRGINEIRKKDSLCRDEG
ncbi:MAG: nitrate reductase [Nitrospiraceae bacterium]|nr:MAG: nitrate reductase [Nitrospiraceae bacterium]